MIVLKKKKSIDRTYTSLFCVEERRGWVFCCPQSSLVNLKLTVESLVLFRFCGSEEQRLTTTTKIRPEKMTQKQMQINSVSQS